MNGVVISASKVTQYTGGFGKAASKEQLKIKNKGLINAHINQPELPKDDHKQCGICKRRGHRVRDCDMFKSLSIDERWKAAQTNELCRSCLNAHGRRSCRNSVQCGINGCTFRHHPLLHSNRNNQPSGGSGRPKVVTSIETAGNHAHRMPDQSLLFRIIPITLHGPKKIVSTFAFLDDGSSLTLVEEELARNIGASGISAPLCLTWTGDVSRIEAESKQLQLEISSANGGKHHPLKNVRTVKKLAMPVQTLPINEFMNQFKHLQGLPLSGYENAIPQLLIGVNNLRLTLPLKVKEGNINEPVAMKTRLGWCVFGGSGSHSSPTLNFHVCACEPDRELHELVKNYFVLDDVGTEPAIKVSSAEDRRAERLLDETTLRVGERFETGLLWRYDDIEFPDIYGMALRRLGCLERRMERNPSLKENIFRQIDEYELKGYAHRASEDELKTANPKRVWYLPLGAVINPKKPEKVRLIWDAAATVDGISLNALLLKGPDQLTSLPAVLARFRQFAVAVTADIKEMFHQMEIRREDRHSLRFLFRKDSTASPDVYVMDVATFGATCSPASAQYVKNKNAGDFVEEFPRAVEGIIDNHYVDDYLDSSGAEIEAIQVSEQVKAIHSKAGFLLRNWQSNSVVVKQHMGEAVDTSNRHVFQDKTTEYGRVLGMLWLTDEDALSFSVQLKDDVQQILQNDSCPTKRQVLRCIMSFFDPLGLLSVLMVHGKILLQDIWRAGTQWDEHIGDDHWERWQSWIGLLQQISTVKIPRCYFPNATLQSYRQLQLHVFVDASEVAYAAVAYFRIVDVDGIT
ncbi:uncharacterized protein LOC128735909 [Sabethes cyaneus]|uniref:uncharacterized protein LOC128735909 n=1 Tax=Sabethes cyaneus TaxID=53552 RepID=UPI00237D4577|nr:uncharacterized protein LOC128735909 [Sabethes cyaneus]